MSVTSKPRTLLSISLVAVALLSPACGGGSSPAAPTPTSTPIAAPFVTDTFTGTISKGGTALLTYTVKITGTVNINFVSLVPQSTITMGLVVGTPGLSGCSPSTAQENFSPGTVVTGTMGAGTYCLVLYDSGNVTETDTYTLTVSHF